MIPPDPVPPITPGAGKISEQQYGGLQEGIEESALVATLGAPFRTVTAAGYRILEYSFDADHVATFWIKNGTTTVERKNRK